MKRKLGIVLFWLSMMFCLVRYEAFPERFSRTLSGYKQLMRRDVLIQDAWMRILFRDAPIGYSHTEMDIDENSANEHHRVDNHVHLRMQLMGETQDIHVKTEVRLDVMQQLQTFRFSLSSRNYSVRVTARRTEGETFAVKIKTGDTAQDTSLQIPDDVVIYSPMTEMALRELQPGDSMRMKTLDPASLSQVELVINALRNETLTLAGQEVAAKVLAVEYMGMVVHSWVDTDGNMLRQETPFGWTMERCTPDEAFDAVQASSKRHDILAGMAVPCSTPLRRPRAAYSLHLRVLGITPGEIGFPSERQQVVAEQAGSFEMVSRAAQLHPPPGPTADKADFTAELSASPWIQSADEQIVSASRTITAGFEKPLDKALAIGRWVHKEVRKEMTVSLPSALDVLHTMAGDCNEHTYLYVALARAAGLPARIMVGLAYHEGSFYYHAWPAVYVGHWLELDPTWGEDAVDATHIALVEGELANQLQLGRVMGRIRFELLSEDMNPQADETKQDD